jgi:spermidine synthase
MGAEVIESTQKDGTNNSSADSPFSIWQLLLWIALPIIPSVMLLAVTNHLCQDVAVIPFLWIAPLSVYLISFIICFDREKWYRRRLFAALTMISILFLCTMQEYDRIDLWASEYAPWISFKIERLAESIVVQTTTWLSMLFFVCMLCHGEVVRLKPSNDRLTAFYLSISTGGALGGIFVAVLCPLWFNNYVELGGGLVVSFLCAGLVLLRPETENRLGLNRLEQNRLGRGWKTLVSIATVGGLAVLVFMASWASFLSPMVSSSSMSIRSFYGIMKIHNYLIEPTEEFQPAEGTYERRIVSGRIMHGKQFTDQPRMPTSYFSHGSGLGVAMRFHRAGQSRRVGVVGLGAGTIAAYGESGDTYRFYEINPSVTNIATKYFTFLSDCPADVEVVPGDGRLSMEYEEPQAYDVLVVDAFSGDAIPVHLLTVEAFEVYQKHLKPDGILAIHVSNRYVELNGVVARLAQHYEMSYLFVNRNVRTARENRSRWMLLSPSAETLNQPEIRAAESTEEIITPVSLWTDDYSNILEILK